MSRSVDESWAMMMIAFLFHEFGWRFQEYTENGTYMNNKEWLFSVFSFRTYCFLIMETCDGNMLGAHFSTYGFSNQYCPDLYGFIIFVIKKNTIQLPQSSESKTKFETQVIVCR